MLRDSWGFRLAREWGALIEKAWAKVGIGPQSPSAFCQKAVVFIADKQCLVRGEREVGKKDTQDHLLLAQLTTCQPGTFKPCPFSLPAFRWP